MAIKTSGSLSLQEIADEFGGTTPHSLSEYYAGGGFVPSGTSGINGLIPTSGAISFNVFYGATSDIGSAYFVGGLLDNTDLNSSVNSAEKLNFITESISLVASVLADGARYGIMGVNSSEKGYFGGGNSDASTSRNFIDGILFSNDTAFNPTAVLADGARWSGVGVNSSVKGYFGGGVTGNAGGTHRNFIDGILFSNDTAFNPTAVLADGARRNIAGVNTSEKGYFVGGVTGNTNRNFIDGILFSNDTAFNPTAQAVPLFSYVGCNSSSKGYLMSIYSDLLLRALLFSTETIETTSMQIGYIWASSGSNSSTRGYFAGGTGAKTIPSKTVSFVDFNTDTGGQLSNALVNFKTFGTGVQSGGYL